MDYGLDMDLDFNQSGPTAYDLYTLRVRVGKKAGKKRTNFP